MKKAVVFFAVASMGAMCFSQQLVTLPEIVSFMSTNDYRSNFMLTNNLDFVAASYTGILERSTCKLLKASILLDHSENVANSASFDCATNLCREIEVDLSGVYAWQRIGSLCIFTNAMIDDGNPEVAFAASTNLLRIFNCGQCLNADTNVWNVLFKPGGLDIMPPVDFIKANAAASLFKMNPNAELYPYTNGVPHEILSEIIGESEGR